MLLPEKSATYLLLSYIDYQSISIDVSKNLYIVKYIVKYIKNNTFLSINFKKNLSELPS